MKPKFGDVLRWTSASWSQPIVIFIQQNDVDNPKRWFGLRADSPENFHNNWFPIDLNYDGFEWEMVDDDLPA